MYWFLYDRDLRHQSIKNYKLIRKFQSNYFFESLFLNFRQLLQEDPSLQSEAYLGPCLKAINFLKRCFSVVYASVMVRNFHITKI